ALDDRVTLPAAIAHMPPLSVETLVLMLSTQRSFGAGGRDLQVVWTRNGARVVQDRSDHSTDPLAVSDGDWLRPVDGDPQSPPRLARLLHCVELIAHVLECSLEQGFDRRSW